MQIIRNYLFIFSLIALTACASSVQLSDKDRQRITSIKVSETVTMPEKPAYIGGAAAFGALGMALAGDEEADKIANYLKQNDIDVGAIVRAEFINQALQHDYLGARIDPDGGSTIELELRIYGIGVKHGLSSEYKPLLGYYARMNDPEGNLVWEEYDYTGFATMPYYTMDQYFGDPKYFRDAFKKASQVVTKGLMESL